MPTALNLASGQVGSGGGSYVAIQPPAGESWAVISLIGGGGTWYVRQGANRVQLTTISNFSAKGLFLSNACYLEYYYAGASSYGQYQAQKLPASISAMSQVINIATGATATVQPTAGNVYGVQLIVAQANAVFPALTDGTKVAEDTNQVGTDGTVAASQRTLFLSNAKYLRLRNGAGTGSVNVLVSGFQMAATSLSVVTTVGTVPATSRVAFQPPAGEAWDLTTFLGTSGTGQWEGYDGVNRFTFNAGANYPLSGHGRVLVTNARYVTYYNGDGSQAVCALSAVSV